MNHFYNRSKETLPYEKCLRYGPGVLTDAELLAVLIRSGTANRDCLEVAEALLHYGGCMGLLGLKHLSLADLSSIEGIGKVKAVMLQCVAEISNRIVQASRQHDVILSNANDIADYYMEELRHLEKEHLKLLCLDTKCQLLRDVTLSVGTVNYTCLSAREVFREALKCNAVYVILLHNHPSGDPSPSEDDIRSTKRLAEAGRMIGIPVIDHVIIGDKLYYSMQDEHML